MIQDLSIFLILCSLMKNGSTSLKNLKKYYLLPEEDEPHRTCKNKNYIPRLMFLCVCARPRFRNGECVFDGKIGCFPLVTYGQAIRGSHNRLHGEEVIKPITSITRDVIRDFMINNVLPAIRAK